MAAFPRPSSGHPIDLYGAKRLVISVVSAFPARTLRRAGEGVKGSYSKCLTRAVDSLFSAKDALFMAGPLSGSNVQPPHGKEMHWSKPILRLFPRIFGRKGQGFPVGGERRRIRGRGLLESELLLPRRRIPDHALKTDSLFRLRSRLAAHRGQQGVIGRERQVRCAPATLSLVAHSGRNAGRAQ
jgi:hypothetical protein